MADPIAQPPAQAQLDLGAAPAAAPAAVAPEPAPVLQTAPEAAPVAAPAAAPEPAKSAEAAPAAPADDINSPPSERPTLLEKAAEAAAAKDAPKPDAKPAEGGEKPDEKPVEAAKPADKPAEKVEAKPAEAPKAVEPAPAPAPVDFTKFTLPEALKATTADNPRMVEFTGALQEALANPQDAGQKLLDLHAQAMTDFAEQTRRDQIKAFNETRQKWATEVLADPQIGGNGHDTAMGAIARMRDMLVSASEPGTKEYAADQKALDTFLRVTGAGDHPVFMRMLHNAARYFDEPGLPPSNPQPPPGNGRQDGGRKRILYDHPRSSANRQ